MEPIIREIEMKDVESFFSLSCQLDEETKFMLFEPGERNQDMGKQEKQIENIINDHHKAIFVIDNGSQLVGFCAVMGENLKRISHRATLVIGILQEYHGKGLGKQLFQKAEEWARAKEITRLELTVMTHNKNALWLYSSRGFTVEGIRRKSLVVDGTYVDEFYMSKVL